MPHLSVRRAVCASLFLLPALLLGACNTGGSGTATKPPVAVTLTSAVKQYNPLTKQFGNYTRLATLGGRSLPAYYDLTGNATLCSFDPQILLTKISDAAHPNRYRVEITAAGSHKLEAYAGGSCPTTVGTAALTQTVTGVPAQVKPFAAGRYHNLALRADGTVRSWGHNAYGELGDGTTTNRITPVTVSISGVAQPVP